ncbi:aminotransferase class I/II-fold pyridoxal phosphate-dependent enzyme [Wenxinia marina]|uniref:7-keto-8-aminopelargonate synthetase n=1 Tax=Wenxinia marina DSM 24838 TaxID=1123501 RepID=A0A0D0NIM2_9RHOB|nr:pyridoxal phosphate-dependent aminotransferase family protein [Wenxinia marina]KIQ68165.1 7-keto-8-aminopelargonate synthetase [Wenxinia marina DSM 24838]GGL76432.1 8-amino-7-oxononanoate synthase [Wenxinia marina]
MAALMQMESPLGPRMRIDGREVDYFCGTSYHTLHGHPDVIEAAVAATRAYGLGPGTRADVAPYHELAAELADFLGSKAVTYAVSGYVAPLVMLQGLRDQFDRVFLDAAAHYSFGDAVATLEQPVHRFAHRDPDSLAEAMAAHLRPGERPVVASDGIFPSTGAIAPLADYCRVMERYDGALLCIDDAHGIGAVGPGGRGALALHGVEGEGRHVSGTTSKAMGGAGGFVPATAERVQSMGARVRLLAGASPPPPGSAAAALAGLRLMRSDPGFATRLADNVVRMRTGLRGLGLDIADSPVPIVSVSAPRDLTEVADALSRQDILVKRVAGGGYSDAPAHETLRIAVFSSHAPEQIDRLVEALGALL